MIRMERYYLLNLEAPGVGFLEVEVRGVYWNLLAECFGRYFGQPSFVVLPEECIQPPTFPVVLTNDEVILEIRKLQGWKQWFQSSIEKMQLSRSGSFGRVFYRWYRIAHGREMMTEVRETLPDLSEIQGILDQFWTWARAQVQTVLDFLARSWPEDPEDQVERFLVLDAKYHILGHPERIPPLVIREDGFLDLRDRCPTCPDPTIELPWSKVVGHLQTERHLMAVTGLPRSRIRELRRGIELLAS